MIGLVAVFACVGGLFLFALLLPVLIGAFLGFMLEWIMPSMTSALLWVVGGQHGDVATDCGCGARCPRWLGGALRRGMFSVEMSTGNGKRLSANPRTTMPPPRGKVVSSSTT